MSRRATITFVAALAFAAALALAACARKSSDRPLSPQDSLRTFRLSEDFRVELFASEPDVVDPVEMAFDEAGRVYVAEMRDYPDDPPPGKPARSRIRLLEDRDGDGRFEHNTIFADHVLAVSGFLPWKGGLIVTSAPDILYLKDSNGDGVADQRRVLYTGFPKVNHEARITNLRLGIDNWIYAANSGSDGKVTSPENPGRPPVLVRGADFRFHMVRGLAEPASGSAQFGMSFDDWGNRFLSQNTTHIRHVVVPMHYLARAPLLDIGAVAQDISDHGSPSVPIFPLTQPQLWRRQRTELRQQRYNENQLNRVEQVGGFFSAASGGTVYTGDAFPGEYRGNVFTGEVNGNLVHRDILTPAGATFSARRAKEGVEFLASTDVWFRPCNFANAPDGNLYLTDIYREFIETPESIPEEIKKGMDFYNGDTMGRIYRIVSAKPQVTRGLKVNLGAMTSAELVALLAHANGWHRQTAQRLLLERQDRSVTPALREMAAKAANPLARAQALWMLEGLGALESADIARAVNDAHPGVREHAVRLAEAFLPQLAGSVIARASDAEPRVQYQVALTLGNVKDPRAVAALTGIAQRHGADKWFRAAILSSAADRPAEFLRVADCDGLLPQLANLIGARHKPDELQRLFQTTTSACLPAWRSLANGLKLTAATGLRVPGAEAAILKLLDDPAEPTRAVAVDVARHFELHGLVSKASADAVSDTLPAPRRASAIRALAGGGFARIAPILKKVLDSNSPPEVQVAAVDTLGLFDDPAVAAALLHAWPRYSPDARARAIAVLLGAKARIPALLDAMEQGRIAPSSLDVAARARLAELGDRARKLLAQTGDRAKVVEAYRDALKLSGDVARGKRLFDENCASCHMPRKQGGRVGPDLSGINNKTKEELLTSILNPSYSIEPRFTNYVITTKEGRFHDGVIGSETPAVITLRGGAEESDETILRANIAELRASTMSLMPDELETTLGRQGLADVIAYLRGGL